MILDGKKVAAEIKQQLKEEIAAADKRAPHLVIITIGDDPASKIYVKNKVKACEEIGIQVRHHCFAADDEPRAVLDLIDMLNYADRIDGIMVQLPLPKGWDEREIIDTIFPAKDVDGLTTISIGRLCSGQPGPRPCTAAGIIDLCHYYNIELDGKDVTIIGRSNIVGKPLADLMMAEGATVTQCHSRTKDLTEKIKGANIIISAVGKPNFINYDNFIGYQHTLIDVGINRDENGKLCGDIQCEDKDNSRINITPVPGGVGPMTVAELMKNTVIAWRENS